MKHHLLLAAAGTALLLGTGAARADETAAATYADIEETLGQVPALFSSSPRPASPAPGRSSSPSSSTPTPRSTARPRS